MNCPNCRSELPFRERICRSCRYDAFDRRQVYVHPPRAAVRPVLRELSPVREGAATAARWVRRRRQSLATWGVYAASLVPGLGHLVSGNRRKALVYGLLSFALLFLALSGLNGGMGTTWYGLAVFLHAHSIFDLTPHRSSPVLWFRLLAMLGIQLGLLFLLYLPLLYALIRLIIVPAAGAGRQIQVVPFSAGQGVYLMVTFVIAYAVSAWVTRQLRD